MLGHCVNTFELLCLPGLSPLWVNLVADGWMLKDVPGVKRGHQRQPWGRRLRGREDRHTGRENELNLPSLRPKYASKIKLPFREGFIFIKPFNHNFAGEKLRKPRVLCIGDSFIEPTCRVATTHPCIWGHGSSYLTLPLRLNCHCGLPLMQEKHLGQTMHETGRQSWLHSGPHYCPSVHYPC